MFAGVDGTMGFPYQGAVAGFVLHRGRAQCIGDFFRYLDVFRCKNDSQAWFSMKVSAVFAPYTSRSWEGV